MWADKVSSMPVGPPREFESNTDRIIREAMEAGEFDDLPGEGKPIPGAGPVDDEYWWIRSWIQKNLLNQSERESIHSE